GPPDAAHTPAAARSFAAPARLTLPVCARLLQQNPFHLLRDMILSPRFSEQAEAFGRTQQAPASQFTQLHARSASNLQSAARGEINMTDNRISASLSQADQQAVLSAINTIREKLPFLIDLTPEERHTLPKMGDKSRGFVSQALDLATLNTDILPRSFDVDEMRKDVELLNALSPVMTALAQ